MRALALFFLALCLTVPQANARGRKVSPKTPTRAESNFMKNLLKKCDNGQGQSCYDYAITLRGLNNPKNEKRASIYIRRACTLAYAPACNRPEKPETAKLVGGSGDKGVYQKPNCGAGTLKTSTLSAINLSGGRYGQQIIRIGKDSMFEKAGLRVGDVVTKVNGSIFTHGSQMSKALDDGGAMVEVVRGPAMIPLALSCPRN